MALLMQLGILPQGFGMGEQDQGNFPSPFNQFNPFGYGQGRGQYGQGNYQPYQPQSNPYAGLQPGQSQPSQFPGLPPQAYANAFHQNPTALAQSQAPTGLPTPRPFGGELQQPPRPFQPQLGRPQYA
jgi:hypothetical protein